MSTRCGLHLKYYTMKPEEQETKNIAFWLEAMV